MVLHRISRLLVGVWFVSGMFILTSCMDPAPIPTTPPDGWTSDALGIRWWRVDTDTTGIFRKLDTLADLGARDAYLDGYASATSDEEARRKVAVLVKKNLLPLYRNRPDVVDSLFHKFVVPTMADAEIRGDVRPVIDKYKRDGYRILARHFRAPFPLTELGEDIPVPVPDSLLQSGVDGVVFLQVSVNELGEPVGIQLIYGLHPVLNRIAMRGTTDMRWQPAYLLRGGKSVPISSWARFKVRFATGAP